MRKKIEITRNKIYEAAQNNDWERLIDYLRWSKKEIDKDDLLRNAFNNTISGLFASNWEELDKDKLVDGLRIIDNFKNKYLNINDKQHEKAIEFLVMNLQETDIKLANHYAKIKPGLSCSKKIIKAYKDSERREILHAKTDKIRIDESIRISNSLHTISLFKSKQEKDFFYAVRDVFQMYSVYPNMAVSSVIDFESIKSKLNQQEREYFFKAVIDTVVVDHLNDFKPIHFFELDSHYHFEEKQKKKDSMKDKILRIAGCKLYRILKESNQVSIDDFKTAIKYII